VPVGAISGPEHAELVERAGHRAHRSGRELDVEGGVVQLRVPEQDLDDADINAVNRRTFISSIKRWRSGLIAVAGPGSFIGWLLSCERSQNAQSALDRAQSRRDSRASTRSSKSPPLWRTP
jgi:hypothetical protein